MYTQTVMLGYCTVYEQYIVYYFGSTVINRSEGTVSNALKKKVRTGQAQQHHQHTDCTYGNHTHFVRIVTIMILFHIGQL